jgi:hypothetical protein
MADAAHARLLALAMLRQLVAVAMLLAARTVDVTRDNMHTHERVGCPVARTSRVAVLRAININQRPLGPGSFECLADVARSGGSSPAT